MNLFRTKRPLLRGFLFPGFYQPLPTTIQKKILHRADREGLKGTGEPLFLHVRYKPDILKNEKLMTRLDSFISKYGFNRNLAFTSLVVGLALLIRGRFRPDPELTKYAAIAIVVGLLLIYRYLKFFRQYSYELFNTYGGEG